MRTRPVTPVDEEHLSTLHEIALSAELSCVWAVQLSEALDAYAGAARQFFQDYAAGRDPDPVELLVRFGAAHELLGQISDRFEVGADALTGLRFNLAPPPLRLARPEAESEVRPVIQLRERKARKKKEKSE